MKVFVKKIKSSTKSLRPWKSCISFVSQVPQQWKGAMHFPKIVLSGFCRALKSLGKGAGVTLWGQCGREGTACWTPALDSSVQRGWRQWPQCGGCAAVWGECLGQWAQHRDCAHSWDKLQQFSGTWPLEAYSTFTSYSSSDDRATHQIYVDTHTILEVSLLKLSLAFNRVQFKGMARMREQDKEFMLFGKARSGG